MSNTRKAVLRDRMNKIMDRSDGGYDSLSESDQDDFMIADAELRKIERAERADAIDGSQLRGAPRGHADQDEYSRAFSRYMRHGDISGLTNFEEARVSGGFTTAPNQGQTDTGNAGYQVAQLFWQNLQVALKAYGGLASHYRQVTSPTGAVMPWPVIDPTGVTASILGQELTSLSVVNNYAFGQGVMNAYTVYTSPLLVSIQELADSAFDVDSLVSRLIGEAIGRQMASYAVSGTGSGQPQGVITALNARGSVGTVGGAIAATGGFVTMGTATAVKTFAGTPTELVSNTLAPSTIIAMMQAVDPAYYPSCAWFFNTTQLWGMRSVVDTQDRPLLNFSNGMGGVDDQDGRSQGVTGNMDDGIPASSAETNVPIARLFGFPVYADGNVPNLTASTTGGPVFGAMDHAMVQRTVEGSYGGASILRLDQRYADQLAVGYIGFVRGDIRSNDLRAAVTVKPAAT